MNDVFLGGTCNNSKWRDDLIKKLHKDVKYFNPVVDDWTEEAQKEEIKQRESCNKVLYVITPKMTGVYSIAELVEDSIKSPDRTIFCYLDKDGNNKFDEHQIKSLEMVKEMVYENGATTCDDLVDVAEFLNVGIDLVSDEV